MILEGNERGNGGELARHLLNPRDNDHVTVHSIEGFIADDLFGAFNEVEAVSFGTQCQKHLFSLSLNPPPDKLVSIDAFEDAIASVEKKLGLIGQPRAIVFHEKVGRRHAHCVWSRIDAKTMRAIKLSHYKRKLMDVSRDLYLHHEWDIPEGFKDHIKRDPNTFDRIEAGQAKRAKADPKVMKEMFKLCWVQSDSRSGFAVALWEEGFLLARGNRRGFVAVDANGKIWSLSRWCGVKPKELRARLGSEDQLWSISEATAAHSELGRRATEKTPNPNEVELERRRQLLVDRQRTERTALNTHHDARRLSEIKDRESRLPTGLNALWARVSGKHAALIKEFAEEAEKNQTRDHAELQALIDQHLKERNQLIKELRQPNLTIELDKVFERAGKPDPRQQLILPADDLPFTQTQLLKRPDLILDHISKKRSRFERADILRELAKRISDPMELKLAADTALQSPNLVRLLDAPETDLTTRDYLNAEKALDTASAKLADGKGFTVNPSHIQSAMTRQDAEMEKSFGGNLSDEQRQALNHVLSPDQFACVVGLAGAGKSTMLKTANDAWRRQGLTVHGAALAGKAAEGLQSASGITSRTIASLETSWENGYHPISTGDVVLVDEAGMIGTRQTMRLTQKLQEIGAKLVLVGDPDQLQPIEAGKPFQKLIENHGAARLTEILRQKEEWQREASRALAEGRISEAINAYGQRGAVTQMWTRDTALAALVEDYVSDVEMNGLSKSRLAFAHRRKDVHALNQGIRAAIRLGDDTEPEYLYDTATGPRAFAKGDRIVFGRNDKTLGVKNGMLGSVIEVSNEAVVVQLDAEGGRGQKVTFNPSQYRHFDHGYAVTIHKSQSATVDKSFVLVSKSMDGPLTYVSMTRHREATKVFTNTEDRPAWLDAMPEKNTASRKRENVRPYI